MNMLLEAKLKVLEYYNSRVDITDGKKITLDDVYVVWFSKTLQNWKALVSTTVPDGMYYELTYNGDENELYLDAYKKWENVKFKYDDKQDSKNTDEKMINETIPFRDGLNISDSLIINRCYNPTEDAKDINPIKDYMFDDEEVEIPDAAFDVEENFLWMNADFLKPEKNDVDIDTSESDTDNITSGCCIHYDMDSPLIVEENPSVSTIETTVDEEKDDQSWMDTLKNLVDPKYLK